MENIVEHTLKPIYDSNSKILILGTMPSPKSRENRFYYSNPQNKFWSIISEVFNDAFPITNEEKENFLLKHKIALWDVLKSCTIKGADDNSIRNPIVNDMNIVLNNANIKAIFTTGKKSTELYKKYCEKSTGTPSIYLPSTSPANCKFFTYADLVSEYKNILNYFD